MIRLASPDHKFAPKIQIALLELDSVKSNKVSISATFYEQFFFKGVLRAFLCLQFEFVVVQRKSSKKLIVACKMFLFLNINVALTR
jgi:hypothetical protein